MLCLTGTIYLFKPQIERSLDRSIRTEVTSGPAQPACNQLKAALDSIPKGRFLAWDIQASHEASQILITRDSTVTRVYLDPATLRILAKRNEDTRFERLVFRLHGQLLIGNTGSVIMELVASWTLVLVASGIFLWWPRRFIRSGGIIIPRLHCSGRARWRDIHAISGIWTSLILVVFLVSGLPWSFVWGHALATLESRIGQIVSIRDWEIGAVPVATTLYGSTSMRDMIMPRGPAQKHISTGANGLDAVLETAKQLNLPVPVLVTPPSRPDGVWSVRSDTQNRPFRSKAMVTAQGKLVQRTRFADSPLADRLIGWGVAFHEGHLFGTLNLILNALTAVLLCMASIAALIMWLKRKRPSSLDAPKADTARPIGWSALGLMTIMAVFLPELAISLIIIALADRLLKNYFSVLREKP